MTGTRENEESIVRAWQFNTAEAGLGLVEVDAPTPGPGEIRIDVEAAGMCHSDVRIVHGHGDVPMTAIDHPIAETLGNPRRVASPQQPGNESRAR